MLEENTSSLLCGMRNSNTNSLAGNVSNSWYFDIIPHMENIPKKHSLDSMEGVEKEPDSKADISSEQVDKIVNDLAEVLKSDKRWEENTPRAISEIHKYNPRYIFLTETSSIPAGYIMKEGLRAAYPNCELPEFFRINPTEVAEVMEEGEKIIKGEKEHDEEFGRKKNALEQFFNKRIADKNSKILIYDNDWATGRSPGAILSLLKTPTRYGFSADIQCSNIKMNLSSQEGHKNFKTGEIDTGRELFINRRTGSEYVLNLSVDEEDIISVPGNVGPLGAYPVVITGKKIKPGSKPGTGIHDFRARVTYRLNENKNRTHIHQLAYIKALKQFGREIGYKIKEKSENN
jgi:hypothetical protein